MPNFNKHAKAGALTGALTGILLNAVQQYKEIDQGEKENFDWSESLGHTIGGAALGTLGGVLPDIIEPANDPNHRKFFHSILTSLGVGVGIVAVNKSDIPKEIKTALSAAGVGYLSHTFLDSTTPKGIPVI